MVGGTDAGSDRALDELYGASPSEFTEKRKALAKALAAAGDKDAASRVAAQRKPTQIAWVLNQLARKHPDEIAELVDVGRLLARAQRKALRGEKGTELRDAIAEQRRIVGDLTGKAAALMRDLGVSPQGHLDDVSGALHAALVDPTVGATLEEGRLDRLPSPATGFPGASLGPDAAAEEDEPQPERPKKEHKPPKRRATPAHAARNARAEAAAQRARAREVARAEAKARADENARAEARAAEAEAVQTARIAEEAEREADGSAADAKRLADAARALDAEAKRLAGESAARAREAKAAHRDADRARADAARALAAAKKARAAATRAARARA